MDSRSTLAQSQVAPLVSTDLYEDLDTADGPAGVVNIVTSQHTNIARTLGSHDDIDALWSFSPHVETAALEQASAGNLKRTWLNHAGNPDWVSDDHIQLALSQATETKTVWVPYGE